MALPTVEYGAGHFNGVVIGPSASGRGCRTCLLVRAEGILGASFGCQVFMV